MFNEEWELLTEPQLMEPSPLLNLSGMATKSDEYESKVAELDQRFEKELAIMSTSHVQDTMDVDVKPQETAILSPEQILQRDFEAANEHLSLYFT